MAQVPAEKSYFGFASGFITDASPISFPDESTQDEENLEILRDGSRKRRRGLDSESGGADRTLAVTLGTSDEVNSFKWRDAGGLGTDFVVIQSGSRLLFFEDSITPSGNIHADEVDLLLYKVSGKADVDVSQNPVSFDAGRGRLIVVGRYLEPIYIEYDGTTFTTHRIYIRERDFVGIKDGVGVNVQPTSLTDEHKYNLLNRGWILANINQYNTDKSKYPAKNMWPWKGFRRANVTGYADEDGTWEFSSDKIEAELFGDGPAAQGHLIINPFDTTTTGLVSSAVEIESWSNDWDSAGDTVTITSTAHGFSGSEAITIDGNRYVYIDDTLTTQYQGTIDGDYTIQTVPTVDTFTITKAAPSNYGGLSNFVEDGEYYLQSSADIVTNPVPFTTDERPTVVKWYAGRVWYMGIRDTELSDRVYFSKIVEDPEDFGVCYQVADPTDPEFNALVASDGGVIVISALGIAQGARLFNETLLIFTTLGVWQISGNQGVFVANGFNVRKLSDFESSSSHSVLQAGDSIFWTGPQGIFRLFQDPQTGFLTAVSIIEEKIVTFWDDIKTTEQEKVKAAFDRSLKRVYFLYQTGTGFNSNEYDGALVYDTVFESFYKLKFPRAAANYITHLFSITSVEEGENNKNVKFVVQTETRTKLKICDLDQPDFVDFDGNEQTPFMVTGYDNLGDFWRFKQAPYIHIYAKKTETGYTAVGDDLVPTNESSILMRPIWDWSDKQTNNDGNTVGHFGPQKQVYRHRRQYLPVDVNDTFDDGFPVVVTRNKLRGRGRVLHLRFDGEETKDLHLLGWSIVYKASRGT